MFGSERGFCSMGQGLVARDEGGEGEGDGGVRGLVFDVEGPRRGLFGTAERKASMYSSDWSGCGSDCHSSMHSMLILAKALI